MRKHGAAAVSVGPVDEYLGACQLHDEIAAREIVRTHSDVLKDMCPADRQILIDAAAQDRLDDVRFMAEVGFDLGGLGENGATALHVAAWHGHRETVRVLLEFHAPVNTVDSIYGTSPLTWAAHGSRHCRDADADYCAIVESLIASGANRADAINPWGIPPENTASTRVAARLRQLLS
jgi:ankyrin repeat protein